MIYNESSRGHALERDGGKSNDLQNNAARIHLIQNINILHEKIYKRFWMICQNLDFI